MERFKKLKDGRIILVTSFNGEVETAHGYNIGSFQLRYRNIPFREIDQQWEPCSIEISVAFKSIDRSIDYPCEEHYSNIRAKRIGHVLDKIFEIELKERHRKNTAA